MDITTILIILAFIASIIALWLNVLATIAVRCDATIDDIQRTAQMFFVWLIPFIGASVVLHIVYQYSPNTIPRSWIPWPFKNIIYGAPIKDNLNRDDREKDETIRRNTGSSFDSGGDSD